MFIKRNKKKKANMKSRQINYRMNKIQWILSANINLIIIVINSRKQSNSKLKLTKCQKVAQKKMTTDNNLIVFNL